MVNAILSKANYSKTDHPSPFPAESAPVEQAAADVAATAVRDAQVPVPVVAQKQPVVSAQDIEKAVAILNKHVQLSQRGIVFAEDKDTGIDVIKVIDSKTNQVLLQFPSEDLVEVAKRLDDVRGLLFRKSA